MAGLLRGAAALGCASALAGSVIAASPAIAAGTGAGAGTTPTVAPVLVGRVSADNAAPGAHATIAILANDGRSGAHTVLAASTADAAGRFSVSLAPGQVPPQLSSAGPGIVNLTAIVSDGTGVNIYGFSRRWSAGRWMASDGGSATTITDQLEVGLAHAAHNGGLATGAVAKLTSTARAEAAKPASARRSVASPASTDSVAALAAAPTGPVRLDWGASPDVAARAVPADAANPSGLSVGSSFSYGPMVTESNVKTYVAREESAYDESVGMSYGQKADSDVSVQVDYNGGGWGAGGTAHVGNEASYVVNTRTNSQGAAYIQAGFNYTEYSACRRDLCYTERYANGWTGAIWGSYASWRGCGDVPSGYRITYTYPLIQSVYKYKGRNVTYGVAATAFGLEFSATSGYSTYVDEGWTFRLAGGVSHTHFCLGGTNTTPPYAAYVYASSS